MKKSLARRVAVAATAVLVFGVLLAPSAAARAIRTSGTGQHFYVGWTEYDTEDLLGLPGNVHVGNLGGWSDEYGTYFYGHVTDFDCDPGEIPWGGGHHIAEAIVDKATATHDAAVKSAIDDVVDSGAKSIDADTVIETVLTELASEVPETTVEEFPPACDYLQDRFLESSDNTSFKVDVRNKKLTVTGNVVVTGGHGEHGEPGQILGRPPINLTITRGTWQSYKSTYEAWGADYRYSYSSNGRYFYNGQVAGGIGAMGFADDSDDESYGGYGSYSYRTVEQIRN